MSDEIPCGAEYPITTIISITLSCCAGIATIVISSLSIVFLIRYRCSRLKTDRSTALLYYVQLAYFVVCCIYGIGMPITINAQCQIFTANSRTMDGFYWVLGAVCYMVLIHLKTKTSSVILLLFSFLNRCSQTSAMQIGISDDIYSLFLVAFLSMSHTHLQTYNFHWIGLLLILFLRLKYVFHGVPGEHSYQCFNRTSATIIAFIALLSIIVFILTEFEAAPDAVLAPMGALNILLVVCKYKLLESFWII